MMRGRSEPFISSFSRRSTAFTLVELLVVVGILAILAAMLAPVMAKVRDRARGYLCLANLRQIGMASNLYAQDYDEFYPTPSNPPHQWLPDLHAPYLKQWRVWVCPSDPKAKIWDGVWESPSFAVRTSYIWNAYVFQGDASDWQRSVPMASLSAPAMVPLWAEGYANAGWVNDAAPLSAPDAGYAYIHNAYGDSLNTSKNDPSAASCPIHHGKSLDIAHFEGGNYEFADGHARWLRPRAFTTEALIQTHGDIVDDRTDPFVTNGARLAARSITCPVFCCPRDIGTPPGDGTHPWFRP